MKYLYALVGLVVLGGIGFGSYYLGRSATNRVANNPSTTNTTTGNPSIINGMDLPDMSGINIFGNNVVTPTPSVPIVTPTPSSIKTAKTYTNQKYGYAFDYPAGYYLSLASANGSYSARGEEKIVVGGDMSISSTPFPVADPGEPSLGFQCYQDPTSAPCTDQNHPADYVDVTLWVVRVGANTTLGQAINAAAPFANWNDNVASEKTFATTAGLSGVARLYKAISYAEALKYDISVPEDEYNAENELRKNAPTYFFKAGDRLVVLQTEGYNRSLIEALVSTFRFI
jgi:hypothetical protein